MFHLSDSTLQKLMDHPRPADLDRIRRHVGGCRACARRIEEWRDNFIEVDRLFPDVNLPVPAPTQTAGGMILLPSGEPEKVSRFNPQVVMWVAGLAVLVGAGFGVSKWLDSIDEDAGTLSGFPKVETPRNLPTVPLALPNEEPPPVALPATDDSLPVRAVDTVAADLAPLLPPLPTSPHFSRVRITDATLRLGGPLRLIAGLDYDHIEAGDPSAVPGAHSRLPIVRVVYRTADGGRMSLDEQLIMPDSSGFRPIEDPRLESGEPIFGTRPGGETVATWLDDGGYRLSLALRAPVDSLKKLMALVQ